MNLNNYPTYIQHAAVYFDIGSYQLSIILDIDWTRADDILEGKTVSTNGLNSKQIEDFIKLYIDMSQFTEVTPIQAALWIRMVHAELGDTPLSLFLEQGGVAKVRNYLMGEA